MYHYNHLAYLDYMTVQPDNSIGIALGFGNIFQWLSIMLVPLILVSWSRMF